MVNIKISKHNLYLWITGMIIVFGISFAVVNGYGGSYGDPSIMGHTADEIAYSNIPCSSICNDAQGEGGGDITSVNAGTGLSGGGISGDVTLNADINFLQKRVLAGCPSGSSIRTISSDGTVTCEIDDIGGVNCEMVYASSSSVFCPADYPTATGGGCVCKSTSAIQISGPSASLDSWLCACRDYETGSLTSPSTYAVCCK